MSSRYGVTTETTDSSFRRMATGVNRNVVIEAVTLASPRKDGNSASQILIDVSGAGSQHRQILWRVNEEGVTKAAKTTWSNSERDEKPLTDRKKVPYPNEDAYIEARIDQAYDTFNSSLKHWAKSVEKDESLMVFVGESFEEVAQSFVDFMNARITGKKINLMLTMDYSGKNITTPSFPPYVEAADAEPSRLADNDDRIKHGTGAKPDAEKPPIESSANNLPEEEEEF